MLAFAGVPKEPTEPLHTHKKRRKEELFPEIGYCERDRLRGEGPLRIGKQAIAFREDMYSLLYIALVRNEYIEQCEEVEKKFEEDKLAVYRKIIPEELTDTESEEEEDEPEDKDEYEEIPEEEEELQLDPRTE